MYYSTSNNAQTVQDRAIVTHNGGLIESHIHGLSNRAIFNDLERPQTQISRSGHSLTLNISEMAKDTAIHYGRRIGNRIPKLSNGTTFNP